LQILAESDDKSNTLDEPRPNPSFPNLQKENASLKRELSDHQKKLRSTRRRLLTVEDKLEKMLTGPPNNVSARSVVEGIDVHLDEQAARAGKSMKSASIHLVKSLLKKNQKGALVGEKRKQLLEALRKPVLADYKDDTYTAHACSRLQDMTAGISLQHFDLLKTLESKGKKWAKGGSSILFIHQEGTECSPTIWSKAHPRTKGYTQKWQR
jgi:hypothetical protein